MDFSTLHSMNRKAWKIASSVRTGILLLLLLILASAAGTFVLQRPITDPEKIAAAYSASTLRWLDAAGLTDVFHSWWFALLLTLLAINLVLTSVERFPAAWRFFARPYRRPESHFLSGLPLQREIEIPSLERGLAAAERAFRKSGLRAQHIGKNGQSSLFAEKNRIARLSAYFVHFSLLLIFVGGIADLVWGYRGFLALERGQQAAQFQLQNGKPKSLPFAVRCDAAGQENYEDGTPRRWWSKLAVVEQGREVSTKMVEVNEPLVYRGVRFFQSSYGNTGQFDGVKLTAAFKDSPEKTREVILRPDAREQLDPDTTVQVASFVPDFSLNGKQVESRSNEPRNPAIQLLVTSAKAGESKVWLFPKFPQFSHPNSSAYTFKVKDFEMGYYTGLQVAYEPGQWFVWSGVVLMGLGLSMAFYLVHLRVWAVPVSDGRGRQTLWVGASASKNPEEVERRFEKLILEIEEQLQLRVTECAECAQPSSAPVCFRP